MSNTDLNCIYNKEHIIPVYERGRLTDERQLLISIYDLKEKDILLVKIKDPDDFSFNYLENIDMGDFEVMRNKQCLDINFSEFRLNLVEMLQQHLRQEMYLKIDQMENKCTLVFYGKSKIKMVVYLTVELKITNQKEIFMEMNANLKQLQDINERLKWQLGSMKKNLQDKDQDIIELKQAQSNLISEFFNQCTHFENTFNKRASKITAQLLNKLEDFPRKLEKMSIQLVAIKEENHLKSTSSQRLLQTMESLRDETIDNASIINNLKKELQTITGQKQQQEHVIQELNQSMQELGEINNNLQQKNMELSRDLEKLSIMITKKKEANDELAKDVLQANQMLVNFNKHYDNKVKQIDDMAKTLQAKEDALQGERVKLAELCKQFEAYKGKHNKEEYDRLQQENLVQSQKILVLENTVRKANKMNTILTQKVSGSMGFGS